MFCPDCETEYREGVVRCVDCDVPLVAELSSATLVPFLRETSSFFVSRILERFESEKIPYVIEAGTALSLRGENRQPLEEPEPWEAWIWIQPDDVDFAREIVETERRALRDE